MTQRCNVSAIQYTEDFEAINDNGDIIFDVCNFSNRLRNSIKTNNYSNISSITRANKVTKISASKSNNTTELPIDTPLSQKTIYINNTDLTMPNVFQLSKRYTDVTAENLSELWFINI